MQVPLPKLSKLNLSLLHCWLHSHIWLNHVRCHSHSHVSEIKAQKSVYVILPFFSKDVFGNWGASLRQTALHLPTNKLMGRPIWIDYSDITHITSLTFTYTCTHSVWIFRVLHKNTMQSGWAKAQTTLPIMRYSKILDLMISNCQWQASAFLWSEQTQSNPLLW